MGTSADLSHRSAMSAAHTLWAFQAHPLTRERRRRHARRAAADAEAYSSDEELAGDAAAQLRDETLPSHGATTSVPLLDANVLAEQAEDRRWLRSTNVVARAGSTQQSAELCTRQRIAQEARRAARAQHLPWRGEVAEDARLLRVLKGLPPLGSSADADQLSDWEEALENAKLERVRFGEHDIVQIGRRRTLAEEEMSMAEDHIHHYSTMMTPDLTAETVGGDAFLAPEWDSGSMVLDGNLSQSDTSFSRASIPPRVEARPQLRMTRSAQQSAASAALELVRQQQQSGYMDGDLDADMDGSADGSGAV